MTGSRPDVKVEETLDDYYERTSEHWLTEASQVAQDEGMQVSEKQVCQCQNCNVWYDDMSDFHLKNIMRGHQNTG